MKQEINNDSIILIDKPLKWTSFDVIRKIKKDYNLKKVGHAGTLDPLATGLLIIATGIKTKEIENYVKQIKEYTGTFTLGATTQSYDLESLPENFKPIDNLSEIIIKNSCNKFIGQINQLPPIFSAIKQKGKPIYLLARQGLEVKVEPRKVTIYEYEITKIELPIVSFRVVCSSGTYIRSLAHDLGIDLQCGAYLSSLRRTKIGKFNVDNAMKI